MLKEKVAVLQKQYATIHKIYAAISIATPIKNDIEKACRELKEIIDSGVLATADEEIRACIIAVYNILESASKGFADPNVAPLFTE